MNKKLNFAPTYADLIRKAIGEKNAQELLNTDLDRSSRGYQKLLDGERQLSKSNLFNSPRSNRIGPPLADDNGPNGKTIDWILFDEWI